MKIHHLTHIAMPVTIILAFIWAPRAEILGDTSRIIYFHVPLAWVSVLAFFVAGISAIRFLAGPSRGVPHLEDTAHNSAEIGMLFTILTTVTGSFWAKLMWGTFWNWDPRETSIIILLLIYIAYFSLRASIVSDRTRATVSASYLIMAMITVPFFIFIVPRLYPSLHPDPIINTERKLQLDRDMRIVLISGVISFTLLYVYLLAIKNRLSRSARIIEEINED